MLNIVGICWRWGVKQNIIQKNSH